MINNSSLAIVGDHVNKLFISSKIFKRKNKITKGDLNNALEHYETNNYLNEKGRKLNIENFLLLENNDKKNKKYIVTGIEAIIGAVYLSGGIKKTKLFLEKIIN